MQNRNQPEMVMMALDIGAESGRAILGRFDGERISLEEVHRFQNSPVRVGYHLYTDVLNIWEQIQIGLKKGNALANSTLSSVGVDTWGVDYALLDKNSNLLQNPYHYRDHRTTGIFKKLFPIIPPEQVYFQTGNQLVEFNTLFQLFAARLEEPHLLEQADQLLMLPDLFHFWLSGEKCSEYCIATTTQCFDQTNQKWADGLLNTLQIPTHLFQSIAQPGSMVGHIRDWVLPQASRSVPVILPSGHDTGCAVTAVPVENDSFMYISSGTWSLVGTELEKPIISNNSFEFNFTNEGRIGGRTRFLKIVPGMWLLQQCKKEWLEAGKDYSYDQLIGLASLVPEHGPVIDVTDPVFLDPGKMSSRIQTFCQRTDQYVPQTDGEIVRCLFESLAYLYRSLLEGFESILGKPLEVIHIIGGGSKNELLNQLTANITMREVVSGPVEATAAGNLLIQAMGLGELSSLSDIRQIIRRSFPMQHFSPTMSSFWEGNYRKYQQILAYSNSVRTSKPE